MCVCACVQKIELPQTNPPTDTHPHATLVPLQIAINLDTHVYVYKAKLEKYITTHNARHTHTSKQERCSPFVPLLGMLSAYWIIRLVKASTVVELRRLNTGSRASTESATLPPAFAGGGQEDITSDGEGGGGEEVIGDEWPPSMGLAGGEAGKLKAPWPEAAPFC